MKLGIAILGSTGSIGESTLRVIRHAPERFGVVGLAARGSQLDRLADQVREFRPRLVAIEDESKAGQLKSKIASSTKVLAGPQANSELATASGVDRVVAAIVGAAGVRPVAAALLAGKDVALANKEAIVVGGPLMKDLCRQSGARLLPVDSEPVALDQAMRAGEHREIRRLILTASGGPFLDREVSTWGDITPEEALAHPTWSMGPKISVDSATLMNKGLELIEASYLFDVPGDQIDVVIHPQSLVHSLVEYCDGFVLAQLSPNDMALPIQYALTYPERVSGVAGRLDLSKLGQLQFRALDHQRFRSVELARQALAAGPSVPAVLSAANEVAVAGFLAGRLRFPGIVATVERVLAEHQPRAVASIDEALEWDGWGRRKAEELVG